MSITFSKMRFCNYLYTSIYPGVKFLLFFLFFCTILPAASSAQHTDTLAGIKDSSAGEMPMTNKTLSGPVINDLLKENDLLNSSGKPVSMYEEPRKEKTGDTIFYLLTGMLLLLALFRFFFPRYFSNLFRVFFNTSLRQSQLTDQLLQARLPALLFNIFFIISAGLFVYFLLVHYQWITGQNRWLLIASSIGVLGLIYFLKYCLLRFTGWITGYEEEVRTYIFIFFLINKIIGIALVPFIILMAFAELKIVKIAVLSALILTGLLILLRFLRSYGLMQNQLKISRFHFFLYIIGIEILPLLLIYKVLVILLNKNM